MKNQYQARWILLAMLGLSGLVGCGNGSSHGDDHSNHGNEEGTPAATNRIDIPASVRRNLGVSFIKAERRQVQKTLRVPGRFEYQPHARREYRTSMPGRVELLVDQYERVEVGAVLYRIDSPGLRNLQQQLAESVSEMELLNAELETIPQLLKAHEKHEASLLKTIEVWQTRIEQLESLNDAGGGRVNELTQVQATLSSAEAELATLREKNAELEGQRRKTLASINAVQSRRDYLIDAVAAVTSLSKSDLLSQVNIESGQAPRWSAINTIEVRCDVAGVVSQLGLTNGAWADEKSSVLTVVQPDRLRFRASGLQSDLGVLRDGLSGKIVPPTPTAVGNAVPMGAVMTGTITLGLEGDASERTIDLFVIPDQRLDWARPGVSAQLEIVIDPSAKAELAIPLAAVQRDGVTPVVFRRSPDNPNQVIRMEADLGRDDGRWVEVLSGVAEGDEIVLDGGFQLMLSSSGTIQKGGHFHADGTFHEGEH